MTLSPGTRLGPYELVGKIGAGGLGGVRQAGNHLQHPSGGSPCSTC